MNGRVSPLGWILLVAICATPAAAGDPPPGPPWRMDYWSARRDGLRRSRPVFVYFTKTY